MSFGRLAARAWRAWSMAGANTERLVETWLSRAHKPRPGASQETIRTIQAEKGVTFPDDLIAFYCAADGTDEMDPEDYVRFWQLGEVQAALDMLPAEWLDSQPERRESHDGVFVFADVLISSHEFGIRLGGERTGEVVLLALETPIVVARSFTEFLRRYLTEPDFIHGTDALPHLTSAG